MHPPADHCSLATLNFVTAIFTDPGTGAGRICDSEPVRVPVRMTVRMTVAVAATLAAAGLVAPVTAQAEECNDPFCTPGITPAVVLGAPCSDTSFFVFGTTSWGRLVFCGSPRRYEPRYFRSPPMVGIKELSSSCTGYENYVAQAPDGLFLTCGFENQRAVWVRGDA
jgi:hypothetical protein